MHEVLSARSTSLMNHVLTQSDLTASGHLDNYSA